MERGEEAMAVFYRSVRAFLSQAVRRGRGRSNGLGALSTTWGAIEHEEFERAVAAWEGIDEELWREPADGLA